MLNVETVFINTWLFSKSQTVCQTITTISDSPCCLFIYLFPTLLKIIKRTIYIMLISRHVSETLKKVDFANGLETRQ